MRRSARFVLPVLSVTVASFGLWSPSSVAAVDDAVPFETLGIISSTSGINLAEPAIVAVRDQDEVDAVHDLLATGYVESFPDAVAATIGEIPPDRVVLIGVIDQSCTPAKVAGLARNKSGELTMSAPGHVPEPIECYVAVVTVAVLSVDATDVPVGSTDHADLELLEPVAGALPSAPTAVELTEDEHRWADILPAGAPAPVLSPRDPDERRFAFVRAGCRNTAAELILTPQVIDARLGYDQHGTTIDCDAPEHFLVVFDVPADLVRDQARLAGGDQPARLAGGDQPARPAAEPWVSLAHGHH